MIPVLRRFDHGQSSKLNCWSYKSADIDGMDHRQDPVDFCEWEIIFVGGEWGRGVHAGDSISGAYLLIFQNISKYLGQEPNYVSIVSEFVPGRKGALREIPREFQVGLGLGEGLGFRCVSLERW